jgi:hypothetical protein
LSTAEACGHDGMDPLMLPLLHIMSAVICALIGGSMGAIAVSAADERRIERLGKKLGVRSKAGLVRLALGELERQVARREMRAAIRAYVEKYGDLDRRENAALSSAGIARGES